MNSDSVQSLQWLAEQGATFALPFGRTKGELPKGWQKTPHTIDEAIAHTQAGGNVGILIGKQSDNIAAIDRDVDFPETVVMLGAFAETAKIVRSNAPERGKLLYRIVGDLPPSNMWKANPADKHPACEFLSDYRHALAPGSVFNDGKYQLVDSEFGIQELTVDELDFVWRKITGESIHKDVKAIEDAVTQRAEKQEKAATEASQTNREYIEMVKDAWPTATIFKHFKRDVNGTAKDRDDLRLLGNGGLMVNGDKWYCYADSSGGGPLEAWAYCKWNKAYDPKMFWDVINDMAEVAGIFKPKIYTNGNGSSHATNNDRHTYTEDAPERRGQLNVLAYRAEDGGILDAWTEHRSQEWLFAVGKDRWHLWNKTYWALDDNLLLPAEIRELIDEMNRQASKCMNEAPKLIEAINKRFANLGNIPDSAIDEIEKIQKNATAAKALHMATKRSNGRITSVEGMARSKRAVPSAKMDINDSINLANGTLNLHSLELMPHDKNDLFTYCLNCEYDPGAECPLFEKYISEALVKEGTAETDDQLILLFQELFGYSLTPQTKREVMVWMFGEGGNGKSVALSVLKALLGPMAISVDFQTLGMPGNYDLADIPGSRVIFSTEAERGGTIAEGYIKKIVTGDPIKTRPIYGSPIDFCSTAKIWWAMNDKPVIRDTTDSIWRRMKLIPFYRKFEEGKSADVDLSTKLQAELPGILNWALRGLIRLTINNKFTEAQAADDAKKQYRNESNPVAQWVNTMTVRTSYPVTLQGALYSHFKGWCIDNGERPITSNQFGRDLKRLKVDCGRKTAGVMYNLALVEPSERINM